MSSNSIILSKTQDRVSSIKWACFESVLNSINLWISGFSWILSLFYMINYRFWASWRTGQQKRDTFFDNFVGTDRQTNKQTDRQTSNMDFLSPLHKKPLRGNNHGHCTNFNRRVQNSAIWFQFCTGDQMGTSLHTFSGFQNLHQWWKIDMKTMAKISIWAKMYMKTG